MIYQGKTLKNIAFPVGGIGTGCISLRGNGELVDWEIFNRPNKNTRNGYSHFAVRATTKAGANVRVLQGDTQQNLTGEHSDAPFVGFGFGPFASGMSGYPHFRKVKFDGRFPIAKLKFEDADFPARMQLTAFNPFIPHDDFHSGLPAAFFEIEAENTEKEPMDLTVAFTVCNPAAKSKNERVQADGATGVFGYHAEAEERSKDYCDVCVLTDGSDVSVQEYWFRGIWQDAPSVYWRNFSEQARPVERRYEEAGERDHFTVYVHLSLAPAERKKTRFVLAWNVPVAYNYWNSYRDGSGKDVTWKNYYATKFSSSRETAAYCLKHFKTLYQKTEKFQKALFASDLPKYVLDAVSANLSVLKTPTVIRPQSGKLWAWEGVMETIGSCEGSCQHVWNYAYALPFLFPALERTLREETMERGLFEDGQTGFRLPLPEERPCDKWRACLDGQMGEVVKCYREWKVSGDDGWLKRYWPKIKKMLEYAWSEKNFDRWDRDKDGVLEGRQHHTLDMELFGPSSWLQGFYLLALDCAAEMASAMGEPSKEKEYRELYEKGKRWTNENLFNGEYFIQKIDLKDKSTVDSFDAADYWNDEAKEIKYQIGEGCIIDQMLADWHADILGREGVFDREKKTIALKNLFKNNYQPSMRKVTNMWRVFSLNDEAGTVICSYPNGVKKPVLPIPYCEETMTGFEYALAGLLIGEGFLNEGLTVVKGVRDRFNGENRNPWNEFECGNNYARSMASYALLLLLSGFRFDMTKGYVGFYPVCGKRFFWSVGNSWGEVVFREKSATLSVYGEPVSLRAFGFAQARGAVALTVDGVQTPFVKGADEVRFQTVAVKKKLSVEWEEEK